MIIALDEFLSFSLTVVEDDFDFWKECLTVNRPIENTIMCLEIQKQIVGRKTQIYYLFTSSNKCKSR